MVKRPTIEDLAKASGVSVATVDRVLNRRLPVRDDTALRVVAAAEAIGYHATGLLRQRLTETPRRTFGISSAEEGPRILSQLRRRTDARHQGGHHHPGPGHRRVHGRDRAVDRSPRRSARWRQRCDALAIVAVDHPLVKEAVAEVARENPWSLCLAT